MYASESDIEILTNLQNVDRDLVRATKELAALPQRQAILEKRQQLKDLAAKKAQVQAMVDACDDQLTKLAQEDSTLATKEVQVQEDLNTTSDYRVIEAHSRELNGIVKRRGTIAEQLETVEAQMAKIAPVMAQVEKAQAGLESQEAALVASFQKEGGALQHRIAQVKHARASLVEALDPELMKVYDQTLERCGGVAMSVLSEQSCSACRNTFDVGKLSQIKAEAPLAVCPNCRRLMIVPIA